MSRSARPTTARPGIRLLAAIDGHGDRTAVVDEGGEHTYRDLAAASRRVASWLLRGAASVGPDRAAGDLAEARVALMIPSGFDYVAALLGVWRAGGIAVPLCVTHPAPELAHVLDDSGAMRVLAHPGCAHSVAGLATERGVAIGLTSELPTGGADTAGDATLESRLSPIDEDRRALILYTSGTTGRPKGAVMTHASLAANIVSLVQAWGWTADDRILHVLPLHHTHGIVNALLCPLWVGAACDMMQAFDADEVWARFIAGGPTVFMAVPTVYRRLAQAWEAASAEARARMTTGAAALRLMVSGSAALPVPLFHRWKDIAGHELVERYGMTEIGMALSNSLHGERRPGSVGRPLPGVEVRLAGPEGEVLPESEGSSGEIEVRGPGVFRDYWNRPQETAAAFRDGWFRTGDEAIIEGGAYRILGRQSVDIIKTGGYKVSALEIESVLAGHPDIRECAVVGVPDPEWGEAVCAALVTDRDLGPDELRGWAAERLARYKVPGRVRRVPELPRNAMGKVSKSAVRAWFEAEPLD